MKKVLITGATGFVGIHLAKYLTSLNQFELYGTTLSNVVDSDDIKVEKVDLANPQSIASLIQKIEPEYVYHLAAFTSPADSFSNPTPVVLGNIEMQMNVLNAVKSLEHMHPKVLIVSSGEVYGLIDSVDLPIDEDTKLRPCNPYAVSKIAQDFLALQYNLSYKMDVVRVRPFNHTGPGQTASFAIPAFAQQIAKIEKGQQEPILKVGNLSAKRDFTDVRDIVKGYSLLMDQGTSGEVYNIGSGKSHSMREMLDLLLSFTESEIKIVEDSEKVRPIEVPEVKCDYSKLSAATGWNPEIEIEKTLKDTLDYWRGIA